MPMVGFGTIRVPDEAIIMAIEAGYRLLDTASMYKYNETGTGEAIAKGLVKRKDLFVCTKLWTDDIRQKRNREAFFESLAKLKTDYVDLYLIHWPAEGFVEAYQEMEKLQKEGYIRSLGVSNFKKHHFEELFKQTKVMPSVNEMEINPGFQDEETMAFCREHGIVLEASAPLGKGVMSIWKNYSHWQQNIERVFRRLSCVGFFSKISLWSRNRQKKRELLPMRICLISC